MDLSLVGKQTILIKTKNASLIFDPDSSMSKTEADSILSSYDEADTSKIENSRILINGAGDYEVGGIKISGIRTEEGIFYTIKLKDMDLLLGRMSILEKAKGKIPQSKVLVFNLDSEVDESVISETEATSIIAYSEKEELLSKFAKDKERVKKVSLKEDKLPQETTITVLG